MAQRVVLREVPAASRRVSRHPQHPFRIETRPWAITPFFIAPVLPGETMRSLRLQARSVSDPIKSRLVGWWNEYYLFYVKHRDLGGRDTFANMMLDPTQSLTAFNQAALPEYYHSATTISWVKECLQRVTEWYFREDSETWNNFTIGNLPAAKCRQGGSDWMDSMETDAAHAALADVNVDLNANATITVREIEQARYQYELLRTQGMTNMSYEDYLASFGVKPSTVDLHRPELVRFIREWTYPTNHIDPNDGSATTAVVWKTQESADKDRYFAEPGFLFGVHVVRPKVYLGTQKGSLTDLMTDLYTWLPAVLSDQFEASWKKINAFSAAVFGGNGSSTGNSVALWVDLKDLFLYGEQYINVDLTTVTEANLVTVPTLAGAKKYASGTDADALFVSASPNNKIRTDGIVSLSIASSVVDTSQTV